ncbi:MAG: MG2 domain-containing protein, partial [Bacteroidota bacterium]
YLMFILEDKNKSLPASHPVSMDLYDPNGALYKRMVQSNAINGFYSFHTATDMESPTGNWSVKVKVGSVMFQKTLKIETVMPNRLKIEMGFSTPYLKEGEKLNTVLRSRWLH